MDHPSWPYRPYVCFSSTHSSPWLYEVFSSFWYIAIPVVAIVAPAFMWPDIVRVYHYFKKRSLARKIGKVCTPKRAIPRFGLMRWLAIAHVHVEVQNRVNSNICGNSTIVPKSDFPTYISYWCADATSLLASLVCYIYWALGYPWLFIVAWCMTFLPCIIPHYEYNIIRQFYTLDLLQI